MGRRVSSRLASEPGTSDTSPAFSPDGLQVYYRRESGQGKAVIQRQPVSGVSAAVTVLSAPQSELATPVDVTADGQRLLVIATRRQQRSLFVQPLTGGGPPMAYHEGSTATIGNAALSPDNLLVALSAGQVGQPQIFLQTFPDPTGGRWPVSGPGGAHPRWRSDGRELFFVDQQRWLNAVPVTTTNQLLIGEPIRLFELPPFGNAQARPYDVAPDGQRFIVIRRRGAVKPTTLSVALNWKTATEAATRP